MIFKKLEKKKIGGGFHITCLFPFWVKTVSGLFTHLLLGLSCDFQQARVDRMENKKEFKNGMVRTSLQKLPTQDTACFLPHPHFWSPL